MPVPAIFSAKRAVWVAIPARRWRKFGAVRSAARIERVLVENGEPVTAESLGAIYGDLTKTYYGGAFETDSRYDCYWSAISHFFESPYYVYKYATSYAASAQLVQGIKAKDKKVRQAALDRYFTLIKAGGSDYPMEELKTAGVDLNQSDAVEAVIRQMDGWVTQLEKELARIKG